MKFVILFPVIVITTIIACIIYSLREFGITVDIVEYEMQKFNDGDEDGIELIKNELKLFLEQYKTAIHITNMVLWILIFRVSYLFF